MRLETTVIIASERGIPIFGTTLLSSRW
ncbi:hypothetical protein [Dysgonomonas sp.]